MDRAGRSMAIAQCYFAVEIRVSGRNLSGGKDYSRGGGGPRAN